MPPVELRAARVSQLWVELRRQWRLPFAILASNDSCRAAPSSATPPQLLKYRSPHRSSHSSVQSPRFTIKKEPWVDPESLQATLEAHRDANRAPPIRKTERTVKSRRENARLAYALKQKKQQQKRDKSAHAAWRRQKELAEDPKGGLGTEDKNGLHDRNTKLIDYEGTSQMPRDEWRLPRSSALLSERRPWLAHLEPVGTGTQYVYEYLTAEIFAFEKYMEPTASERAAVEKALSDVRRSIESIDPAIKVSVIGSRSTGLAMPLSDIDLNIQQPSAPGTKANGECGPTPNSPKARNKVLDLLGRVSHKLKKKGGPKAVFHNTAVIEAKVPIVSTQHIRTGLDVQIQCATDSFVSMELVKDYMQEYPTLRPLFLVLRQVLKMRGLGEPKSYGIGSYPLIIMIVATLKFNSSRFDRLDAARQLLYFFDFYSKIECRTTGISVDPPELFSKLSATSERISLSRGEHAIRDVPIDEMASLEADKAHLDPDPERRKISPVKPQRPYLMCLQDPANPINDLGRQALAIKHVRATFATLTKKMKMSLELFDSPVNHSPSFSILDPCLAGNYERFEQRRNQLQAVGKTLTVKPVVAEYL